MAAMTKTYPTFDCDAHVSDPRDLTKYIPAKDLEFVKNWNWDDGEIHVLNGKASKSRYARKYAVSSVEAIAPGITKPIFRKLWDMEAKGAFTPEQMDYAFHVNDGAREPHARVRDMDLMGIDQVVVIPLAAVGGAIAVENIYAAAIIARAYNDWAYEWCSVAPDRLFAPAALPLQAPELAAAELRHAAKRNFRLGMCRPTDVLSNYPNQAKFAPLWRAFEETGTVAAMHTLPFGRQSPDKQGSPADFGCDVLDQNMSRLPTRGIGFAYEATLWTTNMLLSGMLEQYPKLTVALMECNSAWIPMVLEECDRAFHLYKNVRQRKVSRLPSEIFMERCFCAFEGDETMVSRQHGFFENIGIWSSDTYHYDGADAWFAIREMEELEVPVEVQAKLMGGNAQRMYKIEPKLFVTKEQPLPSRPAWYPTDEQAKREYAPVMNIR